jgi:4-alpha-glucanotransferase
MEEMARAGTLSFRLMQYQKRNGCLMNPYEYEHRCLITPGTHDMPTYPAFWQGIDLDLKKKLKTMSLIQYEAEQKARPDERRQFINAFIAEGLLSDNERSENPSPELPDWFVPNVYTFLARTSSLMLAARLEDMVGQTEQINVPGTYLNYPNWRYKLPVLLENITSDERIIRISDLINRERSIPLENLNG